MTRYVIEPEVALVLAARKVVAVATPEDLLA